ncbi:MAG: hypothetical protein P8J68_04150 [Arenicellaceae bacterium]|nr:hypothetical protein [Arenicellaceae bacterium]
MARFDVAVLARQSKAWSRQGLLPQWSSSDYSACLIISEAEWLCAIKASRSWRISRDS